MELYLIPQFVSTIFLPFSLSEKPRTFNGDPPVSEPTHVLEVDTSFLVIDHEVEMKEPCAKNGELAKRKLAHFHLGICLGPLLGSRP